MDPADLCMLSSPRRPETFRSFGGTRVGIFRAGKPLSSRLSSGRPLHQVPGPRLGGDSKDQARQLRQGRVSVGTSKQEALGGTEDAGGSAALTRVSVPLKPTAWPEHVFRGQWLRVRRDAGGGVGTDPCKGDGGPGVMSSHQCCLALETELEVYL